MSRQAGKAALAAATAASTSARPAARDAGDDLAGGRVVDGAGLLRGRTSTGAPSIQWDRMGSVAGCACSMVIGVSVPPWGCGTMWSGGPDVGVGQDQVADRALEVVVRLDEGAQRPGAGAEALELVGRHAVRLVGPAEVRDPLVQLVDEGRIDRLVDPRPAARSRSR